ncbi:MAG: hypothetical protein KDA66_14070 [Planctomycetaceae bacterium]|nr:hypothetical protein [Planctomycetaceae bacterium]
MPPLQPLIDKTSPGGTLTLSPSGGEFEGPATISRPIKIVGDGGTIWAKAGPVLTIETPKMMLLDCNVEVTGRKATGAEELAILVKADNPPKLKDVTVHGTVDGIPGEEGHWAYTRSLKLGRIAGNTDLQFGLQIVVPTACKFEIDVAGAAVTPMSAGPGLISLTLSFDACPVGTRLRGNLIICSGQLRRRISLTANCVDTDSVGTPNGSALWEPPETSADTPADSSKPPKPVAKAAPPTKSSSKTQQQKAERTHLPKRPTGDAGQQTKAEAPKPVEPPPGAAFNNPPPEEEIIDLPKEWTVPGKSIPVGGAWGDPPAATPATEAQKATAEDTTSTNTPDSSPLKPKKRSKPVQSIPLGDLFGGPPAPEPESEPDDIESEIAETPAEKKKKRSKPIKPEGGYSAFE